MKEKKQAQKITAQQTCHVAVGMYQCVTIICICKNNKSARCILPLPALATRLCVFRRRSYWVEYANQTAQQRARARISGVYNDGWIPWSLGSEEDKERLGSVYPSRARYHQLLRCTRGQAPDDGANQIKAASRAAGSRC